jgi:hypothetical protein
MLMPNTVSVVLFLTASWNDRQSNKKDSESIMKIISRYLAFFSILAFAVMAVTGVHHHQESTYQLYICHAKGAVSVKNLAKIGPFTPTPCSSEEPVYLNFCGFVSTGKTVQFEPKPLLSNSSRAPPSII